MTTYNLEIREHEGYGILGIVADTGRPYFEPLQGMTIAHDILEHTATPHSDPVIDEMMALGGVIAGRLEADWRPTGRFKEISYADIASDIQRIAVDCFMQDEEFCGEECGSYLMDSYIMERIREAVMEGLEEAVREIEGDGNDAPIYDADRVVAWICKGYQQHKKRFGRYCNYGISRTLFNKIEKVCEDWLKDAVEGQTAKLRVDFKGYDCCLIVDDTILYQP